MKITATDIDQLIEQLKGIREQHGNIAVYHSDCEWGVQSLELKLGRVMVEHGSLCFYDDESRLYLERECAEPFDPQPWIDHWNADPSNSLIWPTVDNLVNGMRAEHDRRVAALSAFKVEKPTLVLRSK